jgi:hypothetical protein
MSWGAALLSNVPEKPLKLVVGIAAGMLLIAILEIVVHAVVTRMKED